MSQFCAVVSCCDGIRQHDKILRENWKAHELQAANIDVGSLALQNEMY